MNAYGSMKPGKTGGDRPLSEIFPPGTQIPHKAPYFCEVPFYLRWPPAIPMSPVK